MPQDNSTGVDSQSGLEKYRGIYARLATRDYFLKDGNEIQKSRDAVQLFRILVLFPSMMSDQVLTNALDSLTLKVEIELKNSAEVVGLDAAEVAALQTVTTFEFFKEFISDPKDPLVRAILDRFMKVSELHSGISGFICRIGYQYSYGSLDEEPMEVQPKPKKKKKLIGGTAPAASPKMPNPITGLVSYKAPAATEEGDRFDETVARLTQKSRIVLK